MHLERTQSQIKKNNRDKINPTSFVRIHSVDFIISENDENDCARSV